MGVTVAYRGRLADLARIEDFEDRLIDLALAVGGQAQVWRTHNNNDPQRIVRGVILTLAPGLEPTSLLVSPEGWLIGLIDIKDAELDRLTEPPWCFTKTQFGPLEGHVALVEMLDALRREFIPDLEISDDGGYYPKRDLAELVRNRTMIQEAIKGLAEGLRRHGLSSEAAEDPDILLRHVERVAECVHRALRRPAEHPPVKFPDESAGEPSPEQTEALWDELYKHNRRQQERLQRALEERRAGGEDDESAFQQALDDLALEAPDEEDGPADEAWDEGPGEVEAPVAPKREKHPLLERAMALMVRLKRAFANAGPEHEPALRVLFQGAGDTMGGLAQALSGHHADEEGPEVYGLCVVQLKRALRGAAFARGALFPLRPLLAPEQFDELIGALRQMEKDVFQELARLRETRRTDDSE
jgi:hypothetical protein